MLIGSGIGSLSAIEQQQRIEEYQRQDVGRGFDLQRDDLSLALTARVLNWIYKVY